MWYFNLCKRQAVTMHYAVEVCVSMTEIRGINYTFQDTQVNLCVGMTRISKIVYRSEKHTVFNSETANKISNMFAIVNLLRPSDAYIHK